MKKIIIPFLILLLLIPFVFSKEGSIKLLAVSSSNNGSYVGSIADLHLEIKEGSGRVFIESFPLTKIDTQITTRTAKQIACDFTGEDCDKYDFFYTIRASSSIVGGPSAGAATTILTIALLKNLKIEKNIAITGTINSGNIIGSVSALKEKIDAATKNNIKKVIIPYGERYIKENNKTIDLVEYGKTFGIDIIEVSDIGEALEIFTGTKIKEQNKNFTIDKNYLETMSLISESLCNRSTEILVRILSEGYKGANVFDNDSVKLEEEASSLIKKADEAMKRKEFYTAASYCYGANVKYSQILIIEQNISYDSLKRTMRTLEEEIDVFEKNVEKVKIKTIADLESYMIAKDRIAEARENIKNFREANSTKDSIFFAASSLERFNSAKYWFLFYGMQSKEIKLDNEALKIACSDKISETEERYQYVDLYFPGLLKSLDSDIKRTYSEYEKGNFALCLFLASKSKAEIEAVMSTIGVDDTKLDLLISQRLKAAEKIIAEQNAKGTFPIFGYSYYEYALNLKNDNESKPTALVYAHYAIELSKLDTYFKKKKTNILKFDTGTIKISLVFVMGFILGVVIYDIILDNKTKQFKKSIFIKQNKKRRKGKI
ncbi:MAG: S16 family serine protease [Candidatus Woesearchaeota archaeon]